MKEPPHRKTRQTFNVPGEAHELTFTCYKYRKFLSKDRTRRYVIEALQKFRRQYNFDIWAYVIMPEHIHVLVFPRLEEYDVSLFLKSVKLSVAKRATNYLREHNPAGLRFLETGMAGAPYAFWMDGPGYDRNAVQKPTTDNMVNYIHNNPVRRGLVLSPELWYWSSARECLEPGSGPMRLNLDSYPY
jgi:putative transposase